MLNNLSLLKFYDYNVVNNVLVFKLYDVVDIMKGL